MTLRLSLAALALLLPGCGLVLDAASPSDGAELDAGLGIDASEPGADAATSVDADTTRDDAGGEPVDCADVGDGVECATSPRFICLHGSCALSFCGDGFVDRGAGEACEPEGDTSCGVGCQRQCVEDTDCESANPCVASTCVDGRCASEERVGACPLGDGDDGTCAGGVCRPTGCGNHEIEPDRGEECEGTPVDGCVGCRLACHANLDCDDGDPCNGIERCERVVSETTGELLGRRCERGEPVVCDAGDDCHTARCVADGARARCEQVAIDRDGDGFLDCEDCDPTDPNIHPGAVEICNMADDDCDGMVDEETGSAVWCLDRDGDGYGDPAMTRTSCERPTEGAWVRDCRDCWDSDRGAFRARAALVHPGQTAFFTSAYMREDGTSSFDYDCDGAETPEHDRVVECERVGLLLCEREAGWAEAVPDCGASGRYATCLPGVLICASRTSAVTQGCR